ncbi:hypothetical protein NEOLEDRAFT_1161638 [Neolentinus lepideus HHB14362 ss-1]|uniref:WD40 repeat-like protein n=1 Tax=Neolentinus lepideus HHB14362 ss-1 TaxID=1314782 RepID=A0A165TYJ1_9AGAM|nr:hypothetical protein NEOLEDRAFT_1161638 [Neolentinus lepideus HHB14362 ss-1]
MPRDLPGLYFDKEKNRYFPLSSKPKERLKSPSNAADEDEARSRKRKRGPWAVNSELRSGPSYARRQRLAHEFLSEQVASTSRVHPIFLPGNISSFCVGRIEDRLRCVIGDNNGWLYQVFSLGKGHADPWDELGYLPETFEEIRDRRITWRWDINLSSEISSIHLDGSRSVATSFGPTPKVLVQDLVTNPDRSFVLNFGKVADIWTSYLDGRSLVLGARKKAVYIPDLEITRTIYLDNNSDVFAVYKDKLTQDLIYAGARNGSLNRFDTRMHNQSQHGQDILNGRYAEKRSSVTHIGLVKNEWQLVVNGINGDLEMFDLRFSGKGTPVMSFLGHINTYTRELGFAIDADNDLLYAAGQDARIRGWSMRTGELLHPPSPESLVGITNPFGAVFERPVRTLQLTQSDEEVILWANTSQQLCVYPLGHRARGIS